MPLMDPTLPKKLYDYRAVQQLKLGNKAAVEMQQNLLIVLSAELIEIMETELVCEGILND